MESYIKWKKKAWVSHKISAEGGTVHSLHPIEGVQSKIKGRDSFYKMGDTGDRIFHKYNNETTKR